MPGFEFQLPYHDYKKEKGRLGSRSKGVEGPHFSQDSLMQ